jgi:peptidoglycan/LPS O-acetylase OafA/YrhL
MKKNDSAVSIRGASIAYKTELDGLRAIAVCAVVAFHLNKFQAGFLGVDVFFVLSGYLITRVLLANFGNIKIYSNFYKRRFFRLFPIVVINIAVASSVLFIVNKKFYGEYVFRTLFYLRNIFVSTKHEPDLWEHTWSLASEEQFYLVFPVILLFSWKKLRSPKKLALVFSAYFLLCQLLNQIDYEISQMGLQKLNIITRPSSLALGCALGMLSQLQFRPRRRLLLLLYFSIMATGITAVIMRSSFWSALMTGCLIISFEPFATHYSKNFLAHILSMKPLPYLGRLSYSIYMWHPIVIFTVFHYWQEPSALRGLFALTVILIVAVISFHLIELPFYSVLIRRYVS